MKLLQKAWEAHGGLDRCNSFEMVHAAIVSGGQLWEIKHTPQDAKPRQITVATKCEWVSVTPYGSPDQRTDFTPERLQFNGQTELSLASVSIPRSMLQGKL